MKIVIMDGSAANPGDLSWDEISCLGDLHAYDTTTQDQMLERAMGAEVCLTNKTVFDRKTIESLPSLKYIGVLATGYNVVDLDACRERGIVVTNIPAYSTFATAQMTMALILELCDKVGLHDAAVKDGEWIRSPQFCFFKSPIIELCGKRLHILGLGKIGQRVAIMASAFGMKVSATPHHMPEDKTSITLEGYNVDLMSFEDGIKEADIVSLHCPLTEDTREIINTQTIEKLKPGAMVINCARGPLINEKDVATALKNGKLAAYAADVVAVEPMLPDNPLLTAPNCVLTPHIAWAPIETRKRLITIAADNLKAYLDGSPINQVN